MSTLRNAAIGDYIVWLICIVLAALIQTNWPELLRFQDVSPDIIIVLVVYFAIAYGEERAMFTGLIGGLYQDVAVKTVLGHHVLCYVVIGYTIGRLAARLISEHAAVKAGLVLVASFCQGVFFYHDSVCPATATGYVISHSEYGCADCVLFGCNYAPCLFSGGSLFS